MKLADIVSFAHQGRNVANYYFVPEERGGAPVDLAWVKKTLRADMTKGIRDIYREHSVTPVARAGSGDVLIATDQSGFWIDPLDGGENYWHGTKSYAVVVAVVENGVPYFGVIALRAADAQHLSSAKGTITGGVGHPIRLGDTSPKPPKAYDPSKIRMEFSFGETSLSDDRLMEEQDALAKELKKLAEGAVNCGCVSVSAIKLLLGMTDACLALRVNKQIVGALFAIFMQSEQEEENKPVFMVDGQPADNNIIKNLSPAGSFSLVIATQDYAKDKLQPDSPLVKFLQN
ncbi:hypothetical protein MOV63_27000 [Neorhizobium sp. SHOUNA12A]|nr:hypothetical protein [Neorhizobium sp. SHOUNA12A]